MICLLNSNLMRNFLKCQRQNQPINLSVVKMCNEVVNFKINTPIGVVYGKSCPLGLHYLGQEDSITDENFTPNRRICVEIVEKPLIGTFDINIDNSIEQSVLWLRSYFNSEIMKMPNLCTSSFSSFQKKILTTLATDVKFGSVISYGELARIAGYSGAARAVGSVMAKNPFQLIVPCHRVVKSNNSMGQYSKGRRNNVKKWLLNFEKCNINDVNHNFDKIP